jgi:hypothetical protein
MSDSVLMQKLVGNYVVSGNKHVAIAVNIFNAEDSHYFDIDPEVNNNAFVRACGWAFEPDDNSDIEKALFMAQKISALSTDKGMADIKILYHPYESHWIAKCSWSDCSEITAISESVSGCVIKIMNKLTNELVKLAANQSGIGENGETHSI